MWNNPRSRSILALAGYLVFFIILIMTLRSNVNESTNLNNNNIKNKVNANFILDSIKSGNYNFTRREILNGAITQFEGKANAGRSDVIMAKNNQLSHYFMYNSIITEEVDGGYKVTFHPYLYPNLSDYKYINSILNQATLISKTDYSNANTIYHYEISTTTLVAILDKQIIDLDDMPNQIEVEVGQDRNVVGITYKLNSYASYQNQVATTLTIMLSYQDFGQIEILNIPGS